jgi:3-oxoadipate enol-lactonase
MPRIAVNGTQLHYQVDDPVGTHGPKGSVPALQRQPVLVLANGIFQRVEAWEPLMPYLEGFTVLRYDMRGQGRSEVPEGAYTPELHADDLQALLEALNIETYHLLGLSNGGIVAQVHAARQPEGLQRLILLCTTSRIDPLIRAKVESWQLALEWAGTRGRLKIALPWIWGRAYLEAHPEVNSPEMLEQMFAAAPTVEAQKNLIRGFFTLTDLRPTLSRINVPTLVLSGEEDLLFPPVYGEEIAQTISDSSHRMLPEVGHVAVIESTALLALEIRDFLEVRV